MNSTAKILLALALVLALARPGLAGPANPFPNVYQQPDKAVFVGMRHGDEFCHWDTKLEVFPVVKGEGGAPSFAQNDDGVLKNLNKRLDPMNVPETAAELSQLPLLLARFADERNRSLVGSVESGGARWVVVMVDGAALAYAPAYANNPVITRDAQGYWCYATLDGDSLKPGDQRVGAGPAPATALTMGQMRQAAGDIAKRRAAARHPGQRRSGDCPTCPHD